ncbi:MAG: hypothetical protein A2X18_08000 [Bacteroidetes bacterium GWF2_40_14]|nr:MAG: hypothetical protein A2X18_08000 [Bacteroidetes bacterium GWF2_40_14]
MKNSVSVIALIFLSVVISSCGDIKEKGISHLPFQETKDGRWGLIGTGGKVLFSNEFTEKPSIAVNGLFLVKNKNGLYEYYSSIKQPKLITGQYLQAGLFLEEVAPVVKKDSPVTFIRKDGSEAFSLTEFNGIPIISATNFSEGMARIVDANSKYGYIDIKGNVVIKPEYSQAYPFKEGYALVYGPKGDNLSNPERSIIDKSGKTVLKVDDAVLGVHETVNEGLIGFTDDPSLKVWGFMNVKGEKVIKPDSKFLSVKPFNGNHAIFYDGNGYGIIDKKGEIIIRAKYQGIQYAEGQQFFANENGKSSLININDEALTGFNFDYVTGFFSGKCFVSERGRYYLIDTKGKPVNSKDSYQIIVNESQPEFLESDFFDLNTELKRAIGNITDNSIDDISLGATAVELYEKFDYPSKESLKGTNIMKDMIKTINIQVAREVEFGSSLTIPLTERVMKRDIWGKAYYTDVVTDWEFAENAKVKAIRYNITLLNKATAKEDLVIEILNKKAQDNSITKLTIEKGAKGTIILTLKN